MGKRVFVCLRRKTAAEVACEGASLLMAAEAQGEQLRYNTPKWDIFIQEGSTPRNISKAASEVAGSELRADLAAALLAALATAR